MDTRKHTAAKCTQLQLPALTRGRGEKEGKRRKEAVKTNTGPCLFGVSCCGAPHSFRVYPHFLPPLFSLTFSFFSVFAPHLALTLPSGFDPSGPLLCVQCLSKQQQQQTAVCSAANGMQLLSKDGSNENEKHFRESSCFLICTSLSLSPLSDARSRLLVKLVITHDHAPKKLLSAYA